MLDLHIHILPGIDDGAKSWEDAVEMALIACESGTKAAVAASHGNLGELTVQKYLETLRRFREILKEEKIPLKVYPGMEIFMSSDVGERIKKRNCCPSMIPDMSWQSLIFGRIYGRWIPGWKAWRRQDMCR